MAQVAHVQPLTHVYLGHDAVQAAIDAYVGGMTEGGDDRPPLVLTGAIGSGKTAALGNWLMRTSVGGFVLPHFIGSTPNSTNRASLGTRSNTACCEAGRAFVRRSCSRAKLCSRPVLPQTCG